MNHASLLILLLGTTPFALQSQTVDEMVDVGNHRLHFHVVKGKNPPILFESGGGDDTTVWNGILSPLAERTGATLITYDRSGFGKSEPDMERHGITDEVEALEFALKKLGYDGPMMVVAHSLGGFYATLFAARHPDKVRAAVLIDVNLACYFTDEHLAKGRTRESQEELNKLKREEKWGAYFLFSEVDNTVAVMRRSPFPASIPVTDIVAGKAHNDSPPGSKSWRSCHQQFVEAAPNREAIVADTGHYVYRSNPEVVIDAIVKQYAVLLPVGFEDDRL
jgi:pimeloyl-ACP methyl ester carboxylesterase